MELPNELQTAIDNEVSSLSSKMENIVAELSHRYRLGLTDNKGKFLRTSEDISAYVAFRMPATFAAVFASLSQVKERLSDWRPKSLLDVGAGPGTVMWAATAIWPVDIHQFTLLEREESMIRFGSRLASYSSNPHVRKADWRNEDLQGKWESSRHDLVMASYVLGELKPNQAEQIVNKLWGATDGILLLIEPGTPEGFSRIKQARDYLIAAGGYVVAPCPHNGRCPIVGNDWCHFVQRIARSRLHRQSKAGILSYEDEKFSYIAVSRMGEAAFSKLEGRVIRHPQVRKGHIHIQVCTADGLEKKVITRKDRESFREARHLCWGDGLPQPKI